MQTSVSNGAERVKQRERPNRLNEFVLHCNIHKAHYDTTIPFYFSKWGMKILTKIKHDSKISCHSFLYVPIYINLFSFPSKKTSSFLNKSGNVDKIRWISIHNMLFAMNSKWSEKILIFCKAFAKTSIQGKKILIKLSFMKFTKNIKGR